MRRIAAILFFLAPFAMCSQGIPADSVYHLGSVEITADRILPQTYLEYSPNAVIDNKEITRSQPWQTSELLGDLPGLYIRNYGGLGGMKTVSLRGASAGQTAVMIDGVRVSSVQSGVVDLSTLPVALLQRVETARGGQSAHFGAGAMGGVVNMALSPGIHDNLSISARRGAFGEMQFTGGGSLGIGGSNNAAFAEYTASDGDYPIDTDGGEELRRSNADYRNFALTLASDIHGDDKFISGWYFFRNTGRGLPGPVIRGRSEDRTARMDESQHFAIASLIMPAGGDSEISMKTAFRSLITNYRAPDAAPDSSLGSKADFYENEISMHSHYDTKFGGAPIRFAAGFSYSTLVGDMLHKSTAGEVDRLGVYASATAEQKFDIAGAVMNSFAAVRFDGYSDAGTALSGSAAVSAELPYEFAVLLNWSYNFRPPAFNEMYYLNYGTSSLSPEKSFSFDLGLRKNFGEYIYAQANAFMINTYDKITSVPRSPLSWSAQNISRTRSAGLEIESGLRLCRKKLNISANYTLQRVEDLRENSYTFKEQLPYVPQEMAAVSVDWQSRSWAAGGNVEYIGHRFYLPENTAWNYLPAYNLLNIYALKTFKVFAADATIRGEIKNILDNRYEIILNYPMPGRYFRIGVTLNFGKK
jgi:outer membrane cobalamin receptor